MTADYCLLLVFGNSGENNLLLLEADVCVCVCVWENFRNSRSKTNNHHCAYIKKTVCKPGGLKPKQGMRLRGLLLESGVLWEGSDCLFFTKIG